MGNDDGINLSPGVTAAPDGPIIRVDDHQPAALKGEEDLLGRVSDLMEARRSKPVNDHTKQQQQPLKSVKRSRWEFCCGRSAVAIVIRQSEFEEFSKITCALCHRLLQHPIVLPCQHMLCLECGINLRDCPTCQRSYSATTTSLANLSLPDVLAKKLDRDKQSYMAQSKQNRIH